MTSMRRLVLTALAVCVAGGLSVVLAKNFVKPVAQPAETYPAHDSHPEEKVAIAADPYDTAKKAEIFSVDYREYGFLPVFFVVTNDGAQPVSIANMEVQLVTQNRSKLTPIDTGDIYRRLSNPQARTGPAPSPIPIPRKKVKGTVSSKELEEIQSSQFAAKAVEPHSTQSGFLFFDVGGISSPLVGAHLFVSGVQDAKGAELIYFEILMDKYLEAGKTK